MMGFNEAIATCFRKYATFTGRAARSEYWYFYLFFALATSVATILDWLVAPFTVIAGNGPAELLVELTMFVPNMAVAVRRVHDTGRSGLWVLGVFGLFAGILAVDANFDVRTQRHLSAFFALAAVVTVALLVWLTVITILKGTNGQNRFGPDPLASENQVT